MKRRRKGMRVYWWIVAWCLGMGVGAAAGGAEVGVDCSKVVGQIRTLHGGNSGPMGYGEMLDMSEYHRQLAIPFSRLHDPNWPCANVVDVHSIFANLGADATLEASYDFRRSDDYIAPIVKVGSGIVYRLGESIEHTKRKYYVNPPVDYQKWTAVCLGIISHYNEGWANGFKYDIKYWEIWNEPENKPAMWTGSDEDYFRLYEVAAKAIKAKWPGLKVGGPSLGYTGKIVNGKSEAGEYMVKFLEYCRAKALPLDFFSWHLYTNDPRECVVRAKGIREVLDRYGFKGAEMHFNEWNYLPDNDWGPMGLKGQGVARERFYDRIGGAEGAAFSASVLMELQDTRVDVANYYAFDHQGFGLFNFHGVPKKTFYAFRAFRMLLDTPVRVETKSEGGARALAGVNAEKTGVGVLVSYCGKGEEKLRVRIEKLPFEKGEWEVLAVDGGRELARVGGGRVDGSAAKIELEAKGPGVWFVKVKP
ncbi:MAG: hypothetical protein NTU53_03720 [Planctomycetota bacterium]|nr:hypothetical protein [Planctomycetota bacterium]